MPRSFALGEHFEEFIDRLVAGGRYNNASEVVREAMRLLEDREILRELDVEAVRRSIEESRRDATSFPADEVLDDLESRYETMAKQRRRQARAR